MEITLRHIAVALPLLLLGCAATSYDVEQVDKKFIKLEPITKLQMRDVTIVVDDNGNIILTPKNYENLSKNLSDIYTNQKLLKEQIKFYEAQMFDK